MRPNQIIEAIRERGAEHCEALAERLLAEGMPREVVDERIEEVARGYDAAERAYLAAESAE